MHMPIAPVALVTLLVFMLDEAVLETWRGRSWSRLVLSGVANSLAIFALMGRPDGWLLAGIFGVLQIASLVMARMAGGQSFASMNLRLFGLWIAGVLIALVPGMLPAGVPGWFGLFPRVHSRLLLVLAGLVATLPFGAKWVERLVAPLAAQLPPRSDRVPPDDSDRGDAPRRGFLQGGRLIGYLERALILVLVFIGEAGAIGFLAAAKSIFRFGELRERENRVEAEYILIGTLASFLWGLICAGLLRWLWRVV